MNIPCGLFNKSLGGIDDIRYAPGADPSKDLPLFILIKFENFSGEGIGDNNLVALKPITVFTSDNKHSRTQFPIRLAYGRTCNAVQGATLKDGVVIKLVTPERSIGQTYTAVSRATSL